MSGSFSFEKSSQPPIDLQVGANVHIFQPPRTPSASTLLYQSTDSSACSDADQHQKRKRPRSSLHAAEPSNDYSLSKERFALETPSAVSPAPFVNTRYTLAGGLDTPTTALSSANEYAMSPDLGIRGGRGWRMSTGSSPESYFPHLLTEGNGRPRARKPSQSNSWGRTMYNVVGVAGKVWEFCRTNAFKGFYAGAGQGFRMPQLTRSIDADEDVWQSYNEKDDTNTWERETSIPGGFPAEDFIPDYMSQPRPAKRIQREKGESDLGASWVMVGKIPLSRESSPTRISARKVPSKASPGRRPNTKAGHRPILPASRPSLTSFAGSPGLRPGGPASFAPTRSPLSSPQQERPVSADVQMHAARMRKRELEEEANLKWFNQRLKAMIKEGKEALGTKFEIEDDYNGMVDEGYAEGDFVDDKENS
ncbi:MAG: hypothetical protein Q9191_001963 [Dirinaria sp. TL-2023a]